MSAITAFLDGVKKRLSKATPGQWMRDDILFSSNEDGWRIVRVVETEPLLPAIGLIHNTADAKLVESAPHDLKLLIEMLEVALGALEKINNFYVDYELGELGEEAKLSRDALKQIAAMADEARQALGEKE